MGTELITSPMVVEFAREALAHEIYLQPPPIAAVVPLVRSSVEALAALLVGRPLDDLAARVDEEIRVADGAHDVKRRYAYGFLLHVAKNAPDAAERTAAEQLLELLFPEGQLLVNMPYLVEVAAATRVAARLENPTVVAALAVLAPTLPQLGAQVAAVVEAGRALGAALAKRRSLEVDKAGKPFDPALFRARTDALVWWSAFVNVVEATYRGDSPEHAAAREALLGTWRRLLAVRSPGSGTDPEAPEADLPTPPTA